jgi:hypothetical protein
MKDEYATGLLLYRTLPGIEADIQRYAEWYNAERPHQGRGNRAPDEVHEGRRRIPRRFPARVTLRVRYIYIRFVDGNKDVA